MPRKESDGRRYPHSEKHRRKISRGVIESIDGGYSPARRKNQSMGMIESWRRRKQRKKQEEENNN